MKKKKKKEEEKEEENEEEEADEEDEEEVKGKSKTKVSASSMKETSKEYLVSRAFLMKLGVRGTPSVAILLKQTAELQIKEKDSEIPKGRQASIERMKAFIKNLMSQRKEMSKEDWEEVQKQKCLVGITWEDYNNNKDDSLYKEMEKKTSSRNSKKK